MHTPTTSPTCETFSPHPCWRALLALALSLVSVAALAQVSVSPVPKTFSPGAQIQVSLDGLALSTNYRLRIEEIRPGVAEATLADFSSGSSTTTTRRVSIPALPAGSYEIVLYRNALGLTRLAAAPVTVGVSPGITLTPNQGAPGRRITIAVSNLVAGSLRVSYAGQTILGPVAVGNGTYTGRFIVPADRPANLPATVPVVVENLVGRLVVRRATVNFQALAPSGLPRLGFTSPVAPTSQVSPSAQFAVSGRVLDDAGRPPAGRQRAYFRGGGVTVPIDTDVQVAANGDLQVQARAPSQLLDGISFHADRPGEIVLVNQGQDADTETNRDGQYTTQSSVPVVVDGRDASDTTFTIVVRRPLPGGGTALVNGAIVEADADYQSAFFLPVPTGGGAGGSGGGVTGGLQLASDRQAFMSTLVNQFTHLQIANRPPASPETYGCPITLFRRVTNAEGRAVFTIRPESIAQVNFVGGLEQFSCPIMPCNRGSGAGESKGFSSQLTTFVMHVYAAHLGLRNESIAISYDGDTGTFFNESTGQPFVNNRTELVLQPSELGDFDLRTLTFDGIGGAARRQPVECEGYQAGVCFYEPFRFGAMNTFPDASRWPNGDFIAFNSGRKARLLIDTAVYGSLTSGRIRIGNAPWANFAIAPGTPACLLGANTEVGAGKVEYVATLPDLTRLPAGTLPGTVELRFGSTPLRSFPIEFVTTTPAVSRGNPNVLTMRIDARNDVITGTYNIPGQGIPVDSPGHGVGRMDSMTENTGTFDLRRNADGAAINALVSVTNNDIAANPGGTDRVEGAFFGFTDASHTTPEPTVLFDTGLIPLFRYTWGVPPIADATLGADFWMASDLRYYGQLRPEGMNATIDPRLAGGVDLFFDLDLVLGLVSGSMRAESELGIAMRAKINDGGLAHLPDNPSPPPGRCFTFDLDGVWEACAVGICAGGRENLIAVREPEDCAESFGDGSPSGVLKGDGLTGPAGLGGGFDLGRPRHTATAIGGDGLGHAISVGVNAAGDLVATHITGGVAGEVRTIATRPVGVQHVDVAFYGTDRAMVVWSDNSRSAAEVSGILQAQGGRAFDDIARTQRLRYSVWDGSAWTLPATLSGVGSEGKPQLAGCLTRPRNVFSTCPSGGGITAVWERDVNQNLDAPDFEVWSSRWKPDGRGWSAPQRVSATGTSSDMLPSVAYRGTVPVVVWAHNPAGAFADLNNRQVAYRFLDGSPQVIATSLGTRIGWVDVGVDNGDFIVIAFTRAQDTQGFVGNRQALVTARSTTCSAGTCSFLVTEPRDPKGRQYRVERPRVSFDENDTPVIGFRAVAYGPDSQGRRSLPGDLPGIMLGSGELAMLRVHTYSQSTYTAHLVGLSDDGLQHWKPDFLYDETVGGVLAVSMPAAAPATAGGPMAYAKLMSPEGSPVASKASALADGGALRMAMAGPDFSMRDVRLSRTVAVSGQPVRLELTLDNIGARYDSLEHGSVAVVAALNGPVGTGTTLGRFVVSGTQANNASRAVTIDFTMPAGVRNDERQTVFVDIVADGDGNAVDGSADHARIEINAMPSPNELMASTRADAPFVHLTWRNPNDARIAGWRIWKLDADGEWRHLGSTPVAGYFDPLATIGAEMTYRIASYSANGMESEPSAPISARIAQTRGDAIFADSFELGSP